MKNFVTLAVAAVVSAGCAETTAPPQQEFLNSAPAQSIIIDFEGSVGNAAVSITPYQTATSPSQETFLGRFSNERVLVSLPGGSSTINLAFDLYIIGTWDGVGVGRRFGMDRFRLASSCDGGANETGVILETTFSNQTKESQHWPGTLAAGVLYPAFSGGVTNTLGYAGSGLTREAPGKGNVADTKYHIAKSIADPCGGRAVTLILYHVEQQSFLDESWGIDNLVVD